MTDDFKSPMFGPTYLFDLANHEPQSGKSTLMNRVLSELAGKDQVPYQSSELRFDGDDTRHNSQAL